MKKIFSFAVLLVMLLSSCSETPSFNFNNQYDPDNSGGSSNIPAAPGAATVTAADGQLSLSWTAVTGALSYEVWNGTATSSGSAVKFGDDTALTSVVITGLANGTTYYIWLKSKNYSGTSSFGEIAVGTPTKASSWKYTTQLSSGTDQHSMASNNGYLYIVGGLDNTDSNEVKYASINSDGTIGIWKTAASFNDGRRTLTSVVYNGYIYVIGGVSGYGGSGIYYNDVQYAAINADGSLGAWSATTSFVTARYGHTSVAINGYLYVLGGFGGAFLNDVQYAPINADGTLGTWSNTNAFSSARGCHVSVIQNGFIYVIGGNGPGFFSDVQYAPINADGTIGAWNTTTSLNTGRYGHTGVAVNGYLFITGGNLATGGSGNDLEYAAFNLDGTIGTWNSGASFTTGRCYHSGTVYNGYLYISGGMNASGGSLSDVQYYKLPD